MVRIVVDLMEMLNVSKLTKICLKLYLDIICVDVVGSLAIASCQRSWSSSGPVGTAHIKPIAIFIMIVIYALQTSFTQLPTTLLSKCLLGVFCPSSILSIPTFDRTVVLALNRVYNFIRVLHGQNFDTKIVKIKFVAYVKKSCIIGLL